MVYNARKTFLAEHIINLMEKHDKLLVVECTNVTSWQLALIRKNLRGLATLYIGKKSMIKSVAQLKPSVAQKYAGLMHLLNKNIGLLFCGDNIAKIKQIVEEQKIPAFAKVGVIAPVDVHIPPGPTGMDPSQTALFQAMGIATKIVKGQIEIQNSVHAVESGKRVSPSASQLLQKLNIKPFSYGLKTMFLYEDESLVSAEMLDITDTQLIDSFKTVVAEVTAMASTLSYPIVPTIPYALRDAYKNAIAMVLDSSYQPAEVASVKEMLSNVVSVASTSAAAPAAAAAGGKAAAKVESEESDGDMGFSLFD